MRVIGVDPGLKVTGYAVVEEGRVLESGVVTPHGRGEERFVEIERELEKVILRFRPDVGGVESIFLQKGMRGAVIRMAELRGVILATLSRRKVRVFDVEPALVKKVVTGNGRASKKQVRYMIAKIFNIDELNLIPDEADAIAIAYSVWKYAGDS